MERHSKASKHTKTHLILGQHMYIQVYCACMHAVYMYKRVLLYRKCVRGCDTVGGTVFLSHCMHCTIASTHTRPLPVYMSSNPLPAWCFINVHRRLDRQKVPYQVVLPSQCPMRSIPLPTQVHGVSIHVHTHAHETSVILIHIYTHNLCYNHVLTNDHAVIVLCMYMYDIIL